MRCAANFAVGCFCCFGIAWDTDLEANITAFIYLGVRKIAIPSR
jgi:hypothetical protein